MNHFLKKSTDNELEDYFLDLLVNKHIIDREIQDLINIIDASHIHEDYKILLKRILFGNKNIYVENWGTLGTSLQDIIKTIDIRSDHTEEYGLVLQVMIRIIEESFNVDDEHFHDFIHSEEKEDIEHQLIILMKRVLDFIELGIQELLSHSAELSEPQENYIKDEFIVIQRALQKYPVIIVQSQKENINKLKISIDKLLARIHERKMRHKI